MGKGAIISIKVDPHIKDRFTKSVENFGLNPTKALRNTIECFAINQEIPQDFLDRFNVKYILKSGLPIRTITPYLSSYANLNVIGDFILGDFKGNKIRLDPYPEYSLLCIIKMIEKLYMGVKVLNG